MYRLKAGTLQFCFVVCGAALLFAFAVVCRQISSSDVAAAQDGVTAVSSAIAAATITPTNKPMLTARRGHTATLLNDGRVLVVGGVDASTAVLASAEIYDPATGEWRAAKSLNQARYRHTATLLRNGRVLVVGGVKDGVVLNANTLNSAEIYDPLTDTWTNAQAMAVARFSHTATLLFDGRVLVAGGQNNLGVTRTAEVFDGAKWTLTGELSVGRCEHTAALTAGSSVLVAGGRTNLFNLASAEIYDAALGTWRRTGNLSNARRLHTVTLLPNGNALAVGGVSNNAALKSSEIGDKKKEIWLKTAGDPLAARFSHTATLLPNGLVLVLGGKNSAPLSSGELFDPGRGAWAATASLRDARSEHTATILHSGQVLIAGGGNETTKALSTAELYENTAAQWAATSDAGGAQTNMIAARFAHTATLLPGGQVLATGGRSAAATAIATSKSAETYNAATKLWTPTVADMSVARESHTATLLPNGKVLVAGGQNGNTFLDTAELYDPATRQFTSAGRMSEARAFQTATLLSDGRVLVAGGRNAAAVHASADIYNPSTNQWTRVTTAMTTPRREHTATLLPTGRVLLVGGRVFDDQFLRIIDIFDPTNNQVTRSTYLMPAARAFHTSTLLPSGDVLIAGGAASLTQVLKTAELYDPATDKAIPTQDLKFARRYHTATLLPNGKLLAAGGIGDQNALLGTSELFDPATGLWERTDDLSLGARGIHTATLLLDGQVLIGGGVSGNVDQPGSYRRNSELYDVGLGYGENIQPVLLNANWTAAGVVTAGGARFRGFSESSGGDTQASASNYPVAQLRSMANDQVRFLAVDAAAGWSDVSTASRPALGLPPGLALLTIFANGIPSVSKPIRLGATLDTTDFASISGRILTRNGVGFGATILITSTTQEPIKPVTTDSRGFFSFPTLPAKQLIVRETTVIPTPITYTVTIQSQQNVRFNPQTVQFTTNINSPNTFIEPTVSDAAEPEQGNNQFNFNSTATGAVWNIGGLIACGSGTTKVSIQSEGVTESQNIACGGGASYIFTELPDGDAYTITAATAPASVPQYVFTPGIQMWTLNGASVVNLNFTAMLGNPAPALASLAPNSQTAGGGTFLLTVNGSNFVAASRVMWNGSQRETQFVNANQLAAEILDTDIATPGSASVAVNTPAPGGGTSNALNFTSPAAPTATTAAATNVTTTAATLNASVTPNSAATTAYFEWKTSSDLNISPNLTSSQAIGSGNSSLPVAANLTGLTPGTTYYFRIVSQNSVGTTRGSTLSLATVAGYEADVAPRGAVDGVVTMGDWTQVGRFIAFYDATSGPAEFQRADCAPRATLGDGRLTVADWVQAGRYAAALDPIVPVGGPTMASFAAEQSPAVGKQQRNGHQSQRALRLLSSATSPLRIKTVFVLLDALGNENAASFSLRFDPSRWRVLNVARETDAAQAMLQISNSQQDAGRLGIAVLLPPGQTWAAGERRLAAINFVAVDPSANGDALETMNLAFSDQPMAREIVDVKANAVEAAYKLGSAETDSPRAGPKPRGRMTSGRGRATDKPASYRQPTIRQ